MNRVHLPEPVWDRDPIGTTALKLAALIFMFAGVGGFLSVMGG